MNVAHTRSVQQTYHIGNTTVASEIVGTPESVSVWDVQKLNERVSDLTDSIHNRGGL